MTPKKWFLEFIKEFRADDRFQEIKPITQRRSKTDWTTAITDLIHDMGERLGFYCYCKRSKAYYPDGQELLDIDFMWFSKAEYEKLRQSHPEICENYQPTVVIEHETYAKPHSNLKNIEGSFWKAMCVRADTQIMIAYYCTDNEKNLILDRFNSMLKYTSLSKGLQNVLILLGNAESINRTRKYVALDWDKKSLNFLHIR